MRDKERRVRQSGNGGEIGGGVVQRLRMREFEFIFAGCERDWGSPENRRSESRGFARSVAEMQNLNQALLFNNFVIYKNRAVDQLPH
jgi:hypothetical protein